MSDRLAQARKLLAEEERALVVALKQERSRRRAGIMRRLHEVRQMMGPAYAYTSQAGQDMVVDRFFKGARGLTFVDVGGYDGVTGSNTLFLEQRKGWTGLLVEPVPAMFEKAQEVRDCPCLPVAVAARMVKRSSLRLTKVTPR